MAKHIRKHLCASSPRIRHRIERKSEQAGAETTELKKLMMASVDLTTRLRELMQETAALTGDLKNSIQSTERALHLQILTISLQQMLAPENTEALAPPLRMLPYDEAFVAEASEEEIMKTLFVLLNDARIETERNNKKQLASLVAASTIAGLCSQEKTLTLLDAQIENPDAYEAFAYAFLALRYGFLRDYLFNAPLDAMERVNKTQLKQLVQTFSRLKFIRNLPYRDKISLEIASLEVSEKIDPEEIKTLGKKAKRRILESLDEKLQQSTEVKALLAEFDL